MKTPIEMDGATEAAEAPTPAQPATDSRLPALWVAQPPAVLFHLRSADLGLHRRPRNYFHSSITVRKQGPHPAWVRALLVQADHEDDCLAHESDGLEAIDTSKPYVYAVNHASALDIPVLYVYLPFEFRIAFKKELLAYPIVGWHLKTVRANLCGPAEPVAVDRQYSCCAEESEERHAVGYLP